MGLKFCDIQDIQSGIQSGFETVTQYLGVNKKLLHEPPE